MFSSRKIDTKIGKWAHFSFVATHWKQSETKEICFVDLYCSRLGVVDNFIVVRFLWEKHQKYLHVKRRSQWKFVSGKRIDISGKIAAAIRACRPKYKNKLNWTAFERALSYIKLHSDFCYFFPTHFSCCCNFSFNQFYFWFAKIITFDLRRFWNDVRCDKTITFMWFYHRKINLNFLPPLLR